jgi:hypothetical protein
MAIFAKVRKETDVWGVVLRQDEFGSHVPQTTLPSVMIDITSYTPQPVSGENWWYNFDTDLFTDTDPVIPTYVKPVGSTSAPNLWFARFTTTERAEFWAVCNGETVAGVTITQAQRYRAAAFRDITLTGGSFKLDHTELVAVIDGLESAGLLDAGRADEILDR